MATFTVDCLRPGCLEQSPKFSDVAEMLAWGDAHDATCVALTGQPPAPELPSEPDEGSVVRDKDGQVWIRESGLYGHWQGLDGAHRSWRLLNAECGPLRLLVDGPVIA
jgi:hypothetical protein